MRFSIFFFIQLSCLLIVWSCTNSKQIVNDQKSWSIELIKGGCLDVCGSYSILIHSNGEYKYRGRYNVKHLGEKVGKLKTSDKDQLISQIEAIRWDDLEQSYGNQANDSQRKELNYLSKTINKKIVYYRLETQKMRALEQFIDQIINHDEF